VAVMTWKWSETRLWGHLSSYFWLLLINSFTSVGGTSSAYISIDTPHGLHFIIKKFLHIPPHSHLFFTLA
jgi:hypothetical protein